MWDQVRNSRLGAKIVRQKPIMLEYFGGKRAFIADFYCSEARLIIEIDGKVHSRQSDYDALRSLLIGKQAGRHNQGRGFNNILISSIPCRAFNKSPDMVSIFIFRIHFLGREIYFPFHSWRVNSCKNYLMPEEFIALCGLVVRHCVKTRLSRGLKK
jgi:hypothetical protein